MPYHYDPRVLFSAERTLLAWNRTSISLMAFGFVIERFGLFSQIAKNDEISLFQRPLSFFIGVIFILLAIGIAFYSVSQHNHVLKSLHSSAIPPGYNIKAGMLVNGIIGLLGISVIAYQVHGFL
jgi:putative membrane protein